MAVTNIVRLLRLPDRLKGLLAEGTLSEGHARALLGLADEDTMVQLAEQVVARQLSVRQTEEMVRRLQERQAGPGNEEKSVPDDPDAHTDSPP